jgi:ribokinase
VTVLGSLNMDISVTVPRLPGPGATVVGSAARFTPGGKGANQAVAAARLGAEVRMVGCVGDDEFGRLLLAALHAEAVNADGVRAVAGIPTGLALIAVDDAGENLIVVAPGANHEAGPPEVAAAAAGPRDILVISAEIPVPAITAVLARARETPCVLNLAPAPETPEQAAALTSNGPDWLVVNESEAAAVLGWPVSGLAAAGRAASELAAASQAAAGRAVSELAAAGWAASELAAAEHIAGAGLAAAGPRYAVVTAGAQGAALAGPDGIHTVQGFAVEAVDTVGAGDTFVGALAVALAAGVPAPQAVRAAAAAGAAAVTRHGAQTAMPRSGDILTATGVTWPVG